MQSDTDDTDDIDDNAARGVPLYFIFIALQSFIRFQWNYVLMCWLLKAINIDSLYEMPEPVKWEQLSLGVKALISVDATFSTPCRSTNRSHINALDL